MINRLKKKLGFVDRKKLEENNEQGKTKKNIEVAEENIYEVMEKTGWDFEYATEKIEEARKRLGISYTDYNKYAFYNIPLEKQVEEYKFIILFIEKT